MTVATTPPRAAADGWRTAAVLAANAAQILVPLVGPLLGQRAEAEVAKRNNTVITPPDPAFAVWAPIYAACTASSVVQALPGQAATELHRRTGWWLSGAYAGNALWALIVQSGRWTPTPLVLGTSVGLTWTAHRRLQDLDPAGAQRVIPVSTGLLLGWTGLAALVNAASVVTPRDVRPTARPVVLAESGALLAGAATIAALVARSRQGAVPVALTAGWALGTVAATSRSRTARAAAGLGLLAMTAGVTSQLLRRRRQPR